MHWRGGLFHRAADSANQRSHPLAEDEGQLLRLPQSQLINWWPSLYCQMGGCQLLAKVRPGDRAIDLAFSKLIKSHLRLASWIDERIAGRLGSISLFPLGSRPALLGGEEHCVWSKRTNASSSWVSHRCGFGGHLLGLLALSTSNEPF